MVVRGDVIQQLDHEVTSHNLNRDNSHQMHTHVVLIDDMRHRRANYLAGAARSRQGRFWWGALDSLITRIQLLWHCWIGLAIQLTRVNRARQANRAALRSLALGSYRANIPLAGGAGSWTIYSDRHVFPVTQGLSFRVFPRQCPNHIAISSKSW